MEVKRCPHTNEFMVNGIIKPKKLTSLNQSFTNAYWDLEALDSFVYDTEKNVYVRKDETEWKGCIWNEEMISRLSNLNNSWVLWQVCYIRNCM